MSKEEFEIRRQRDSLHDKILTWFAITVLGGGGLFLSGIILYAWFTKPPIP